MRILTIFLTLLFSLSVNATICTTGSNAVKSDGTVSVYDSCFIRVKAGEAITAGMVVYADVTSDDGMTVKKVPANGTAYRPLCVAIDAIASGAWSSKCQIFGYTDALLFDAATTATAGESVYAGSATAGYAIATASASVSAYQVPIGMFFDASDASGSVEAFINL